MSFQIGESIGDYQIIGVLGAGGMGKVYKVKNQISDRIDALKILLPNLADDPELADRFIREIKVLASLNHPNIAGLRTAFRLENQLLMVMEYVEGTTLDERTKAGPIPVRDAINYITQALSALGYAHKQGVIHRDIKPANMMLTRDNVIKLMDFGIAKTKSDKKLTQTGTTMGSLFYMSAEQVQGNELDGRSDLYSIGVSLYEMVTGSRPFQGKSDFDIMVAQLQQVPQAPMQMMPDLPKALNDIIMISLEKDPAKRFQTADAFAAALGSITNSLQATPIQASGGVTLPGHPTPIGSAPLSSTGTQVFGSVPPAYGAPPAQGSVTGMLGAQSAPVPPSQGGTAPSVGGLLNTANTPTVLASQPSDPVPHVIPPPVPSHGVPQVQKAKGYTGLYMALGALIVVAVLAVAAVEGTRFLKARASGDQSAQVTTSAANNPVATTLGNSTTGAAPQTQVGAANPPTASGSPSPDASQVGGAGNVTTPPAIGSAPPAILSANPPSPDSSVNPGGSSASNHKKGSKHNSPANLVAGESQNVTTPVGGGEQFNPPPAAGGGQVGQPAAGNSTASAQELQEISDQHDKLAARAQAANDSVEGLRKQMTASGNNLRSDISASQSRMKLYMGKFENALNAGDAEAAKRYMSLAEREVDKLEAFLGH
jgi:serine/threonine protein kinase